MRYNAIFNIVYDLNQEVNIYPQVESGNLTGNETYGGIGLNFGGSIDYWVPNLPFAGKLFFNNSTNLLTNPY